MKPKIIALYLPQFHPVKENDEWYGAGFTEWTNVAKAKPLFKGHQQPKIPKDLGFYDLRVPEIRKRQAEMAIDAGISAFCYYHYWFGNGKVLLEKPLMEMVNTGEPDFPFCICWANVSWHNKLWNPTTKKIGSKLLIEQQYPGIEDVKAHFNFLLPAFKDERYYKIDGRLLFVIYEMKDMPNFEQYKSIWNELAKENGLPEFYFLAFANNMDELSKSKNFSADGIVLSLLHSVEHLNWPRYKRGIRKIWFKLRHLPRFRYSYKKAMKSFICKECKDDNVIPVIIPNWDNTPRRAWDALILTNSNPSLFKQHVREVLDCVKDKPENKQIIFLKSWNEWGEGNYMEPDLQYGHGYIYALKEALEEYK